MGSLAAYFTLFMAAFLAATIVPAQSEALLVALLSSKAYSVTALILLASIGNTLGSCINWGLGRGIERFKNRKWFPVSAASLVRAQTHYAKYGRWSLLLSWVPIIGDPITIAAGIMKEKFWMFLLLVSIAKTSRYILLAVITLGLIGKSWRMG